MVLAYRQVVMVEDISIEVITVDWKIYFKLGSVFMQMNVKNIYMDNLEALLVVATICHGCGQLYGSAAE